MRPNSPRSITGPLSVQQIFLQRSPLSQYSCETSERQSKFAHYEQIVEPIFFETGEKRSETKVDCTFQPQHQKPEDK